MRALSALSLCHRMLPDSLILLFSPCLLVRLNCCATGSLDKTVQLFDLSTANQRSRFRFEVCEPDLVYCEISELNVCLCLQEGVVRIKTHAAHPNLLFVSTLDGCISLWDYRTSALVRKIAAHAVPILDIAVSMIGRD